MKILAIGNSFSDDCMEYVASILSSLGVSEISLGNLYIGGCSLQTHYNNTETDAPAYEYRTNDASGWVTQYEHKMGDAIVSQEWDVIFTQQCSRLSGKSETYDVLDGLLAYVKSKAKGKPKYAWQMTWAYANDFDNEAFDGYQRNQALMYNSIIGAVKENILPRTDVSIIIPSGTAIQNARTALGDTLNRDGFHLSYDVGRYIAGLCVVGALTGLDIQKVAFAPDDVDETTKQIAIKAAKAALASPFEITKI